MSMANKRKQIPTTKKTNGRGKQIVEPHLYNSDSKKVAWCFDMVDKNGAFRFAPERPDFDCKKVIEKLLSFSSMTWADLKRSTHDQGKSKHHFLSLDALSHEAMERIKALNLGEEDQDRIFSLALENKLRLIGVRENEKFHVIWYDPKHEFCPSHQRN